MTGPRVRPLTSEEASSEVRPIFETYLKERGNIPNMFRTAAIRPKHLETMIAHFRTVMNEGTVPLLLKELLWVRVSHLNQCRYCLNSHTALARRHGGNEAVIEAVQDRGSPAAVDTRCSTARDTMSPTSCIPAWQKLGIRGRSSRSRW
jgi:AhpD family alkylhydroperoxidase